MTQATTPPKPRGRPPTGNAQSDKLRAAQSRARRLEQAHAVLDAPNQARDNVLLMALQQRLRTVANSTNADEVAGARDAAGRIIRILCDRHEISV